MKLPNPLRKTVLAAALLPWLAGCGGTRADAAAAARCGPSASPGDTASYALEDVYRQLRNGVFDLRPDQLGLPANQPHAALVEMGMEEGVATLMAVGDGTASLYFSTGGGVIGSGEHADVASRAKSFLRDASAAAGRMSPAPDRALPRQGCVRFYVLSAGSVRTAEASEADLVEGRHELSPLFASSNELLTAIRERSEAQQR
jgi:hypothetical protein